MDTALFLRRLGFAAILPALLLTLSSTGCTSEDRIAHLQEQQEHIRDSLTQVLDRQDSLIAQKDSLQQASAERAEHLARANQLITDVLGRLAEISRQEDLLTQTMEKARRDADDIENVDLTLDPGDIRTAMQRGLKTIEEEISQSRSTIARLEAQQGELESQLTGLQETITRLRERLQEKEAMVAELQREVDRMHTELAEAEDDNEELRTSNAQLRSVNEDLKRAYVVTAEKDSLAAMGILDKPFFGFLGRTKIERLDPSKFRQIRMEDTRIALPAERSGLKIFSPHRHEPDLYDVDGNELVIQDPNAFWAVSRFLVVEVER